MDLVEFRDLPGDWFPFVIEARDRNHAVVWHTVVQGPGALSVPPLARTYGPVSIRVIYATGEVVEERQP